MTERRVLNLDVSADVLSRSRQWETGLDPVSLAAKEQHGLALAQSDWCAWKPEPDVCRHHPQRTAEMLMDFDMGRRVEPGQYEVIV